MLDVWSTHAPRLRDKYLDVTKDMERRLMQKIYTAFQEGVGLRILSLESVDYFGTSEYFSG